MENRRGKKASVIENNSTVSSGPEKDQLTESPNPADIEPGYEVVLDFFNPIAYFVSQITLENKSNLLAVKQIFRNKYFMVKYERKVQQKENKIFFRKHLPHSP